jgi:hypothetical protein
MHRKIFSLGRMLPHTTYDLQKNQGTMVVLPVEVVSK